MLKHKKARQPQRQLANQLDIFEKRRRSFGMITEEGT